MMKKYFYTICSALLFIGSFPMLTEAATINKPTNNMGMIDYWTFDGRDINWTTNKVTDRGSAANTGQLGNISTTTGSVQGKIGQAIKIDSPSGGYVDFGAVSAIEGLGAMSVALWFKPGTALISADEGIMNNRVNSSQLVLNLFRGANESITFQVRTGATVEAQSAASIVNTTNWYHIVGVYDGSTVRIYINGVQSGTTPAQSGLTMDTFGNLYLASGINTAFDDVRIYNRALSATETKQLYNHGAAKFATPQKSAATSLNSGLVGYWTFDGKDTNWTTNTAVDRSGNGRDGSMRRMSTTTSPVPGKIGQALTFKGTDEAIAISSTISASAGITVSAWVKSAGGSLRSIYNIGGQSNTVGFAWFYINSDKLAYNYAEGSSNPVAASTGSIPRGTWSHVVMTHDYTNQVIKFYINGTLDSTPSSGAVVSISSKASVIGAFNTSGLFPFNSSLDDVRVYDRTLSATEVNQLYNSGAAKFDVAQKAAAKGLNSGLVGYWTFDGKDMNWTTNKATDKSGNSNTGQLVGMSTTTSPVQGKIGQALDFRFGSSLVSLGSAASLDNIEDQGGGGMTVSAWVNPRSGGTGIGIIAESEGLVAANNNRWSFHIGSQSGQTYSLSFGKSYVTSPVQRTTNTSFLNKNQWQHVVATWDGSVTATNIHIYKNGVEASSYSAATDGTGAELSDAAQNKYISDVNLNRSWDGNLDEIRIYNRVLSTTEINQLYNAGR